MSTTGKKITDFTSLTSIADSDIMLAVDVSDTASSPEGTTKKVLFSEVKEDITSGLNTSNWDTSYGWGDHAVEGYLQSIATLSINALNDVDTTGASTNDFLKWNGTSWAPEASGGGSVAALDDVGNVTISSASTGQVLKWSGTAWTNQAETAGGIALGDLSVTTASAGTAGLSYDNTSGAFTYTPPDLTSYLTTYTETDTLDDVATRGATISSVSTVTLTGTGGWPGRFDVQSAGNYAISLNAGTGISTADGVGLNIGNISTNVWRAQIDGSNGDASFTGAVTAGSLSVTGDAAINTLTASGICTFNNFLRLPSGTFSNNSIQLGDSQEFSLQYNSASTSGIIQVSGQDLDIQASTIRLQPNGGENGINVNLNGSVELYHDNAIKFETTATGVTVTGSIDANGNISLPDGTGTGPSGRLILGDGEDLRLYHDGTTTNNWIQSNGLLNLQSLGVTITSWNDLEKLADFNLNDSVDLYYDGAKKFETTATGVTVTGVATATSFSGSGSGLTGLTGASAATYGGASVSPQITVDANGRITGITDVSITSGSAGPTSQTITSATFTSVSDDSLSLTSGVNADISMIGNHPAGTVYTNAENKNPSVAWDFNTSSLPATVTVASYSVLLEDLRAEVGGGSVDPYVHWSVSGIPNTITSIPADAVLNDVGGATITNTNMAFGQAANGTNGVSVVGYSGPQPGPTENHIYRLSVTAQLSGDSTDTLTQSIEFNFDTANTLATTPTPTPTTTDNLTFTHTPGGGGSVTTLNLEIALGASPTVKGSAGVTVARLGSGSYRLTFASSYSNSTDYYVLSQGMDHTGGVASYITITRATTHVDISVETQGSNFGIDSGFVGVQIIDHA